jgi:sugar lactone lactonase YvrE
LTELVTALPQPPSNTVPPTISGTAQQGQTLGASPGSWTGSPTGYSYEWQRCDAAAAKCAPISGGSTASYALGQADVGSTLRVTVIASNAAGPSAPAASAVTELVTALPQPPSNTVPPTISGTAQQGQTLGASTGTWTGSPTSYSYQWQRCDPLGANCAAIPLATGTSYGPVDADVGSTLRVTVVASNPAGPSVPATSAPSEVVTASRLPPVNTTPPSIDGLAQVGQALSASTGTWTGSPTSYSYEWVRCRGARCRVITRATSPSYLLVRRDVGATLRVTVVASNSAGPSAPVTSAPSEVVTASQLPPVNTSLPSIGGLAQSGQALSASTGTWTGSPTSYSYQWVRCDAAGVNCSPIPGAGASSYVLGEADVGATLRVVVIASNSAGASVPATSAQTAAVTGSTGGVQHLEYVFHAGLMSVYDIDNGFKLVESLTLPGTNRGVRGVAVSPATNMMFVSYGGDGGGNGNGSVLAYDLVGKKVVWSVNLSTGIDSGAVSSDGKLLYMPDGELSSDGNWYILDTSNGSVIGKIETPGKGPHNTVMSADGKILLLGARNYNFLSLYNTQTGKLQAAVGPLIGGVRPNTVNGSDSVSFTTATGFDGFQVGSITSPGTPVLYTESFGTCSGPFSTCSHGISLSPDNRQVYVIDSVRKAVQAWDVHGVAEGIAPTHIATVPVNGLEGSEQGCAYDCGRDGWVRHTLDGRYVLVGDSGDVIETATEKVVATIPNLLNTRKFVEIDWSGGVPIATSGRTGVGYAR